MAGTNYQYKTIGGSEVRTIRVTDILKYLTRKFQHFEHTPTSGRTNIISFLVASIVIFPNRYKRSLNFAQLLSYLYTTILSITSVQKRTYIYIYIMDQYSGIYTSLFCEKSILNARQRGVK